MLLPLLVAMAPIACSSDEEGNDDVAVDAGPALLNYANHLHQAYKDSADDARALKTKLEALIASPSQATLDAARTEWLHSRRNYMLTEGARFYEGPIDAEPENVEYLLNGWPLDEGFIDYVVDGPTRGDGQRIDGGIIADESFALTPEALDGRNGEDEDEENIAAGYHAIEFILWGQAMNEVGPGERPFTDFDENDATHGSTAKRRGEFLIAAVDGIINHLTNLTAAWEEGAEYRTTFLANENNESLSNVFAGLGKLSRGEMAGERINAGLESKERRDQHNCFSSTTNTDFIRDAIGIRDFYLGDYNGDDGPGFDELVAQKDPELNEKLIAQLNTTIDGMKSISVYFEQAIAADDSDPERQKLINVRESFRDQGTMFGQAAGAIGISLEIPDEN